MQYYALSGLGEFDSCTRGVAPGFHIPRLWRYVIRVFQAAHCTDDGTSKSEDRLDHRNPAGHSRGVRTKCSAIRSSLNPHQLAGHPQTLRWQEIPLGPRSILIRVGKLSEDL